MTEHNGFRQPSIQKKNAENCPNVCKTTSNERTFEQLHSESLSLQSDVAMSYYLESGCTRSENRSSIYEADIS